MSRMQRGRAPAVKVWIEYSTFMKGTGMDREDEILALLREIRDAQAEHHAMWQEALRKAEQQQERALAQAKRIPVRSALVAGMLLLLVYLLVSSCCGSEWGI